MLATVDGAFEAYKKELLVTIVEFQRSAQAASVFDCEQWRETNFVSIYGLVNTLIRANNVAALVEVLGTWYGVAVPDQLKDLTYPARLAVTVVPG